MPSIGAIVSGEKDERVVLYVVLLMHGEQLAHGIVDG